jgi:aminopeptidase N
VFTGVPARPVPSFLRGFSAPVKLDVRGQTDGDLTFLMAHDSDAFNRWEAGQRLFKGLILRLYEAALAAGPGVEPAAAAAAAGGVPGPVVDAVRAVLADKTIDGAFAAAAISLPAPAELIDAIDGADPVVLHGVRTFVATALATALRSELEAAVRENDVPASEPYSPAFAHAAKRALKNKALGYLSFTCDPAVRTDLLARARGASNMTDRISALAALVDAACPEREAALAEYAADYADEPLAMLKWLAIQAGSDLPGNLTAVTELAKHPAFSMTNPNCCYSLYLAFQRSPVNFHAADGSGYEFIADAVLEVDRVNKQVAARIAGAFTAWKTFDGGRQARMQAALRRIAAAPGLSENVYEIVAKSMADAPGAAPVAAA